MNSVLWVLTGWLALSFAAGLLLAACVKVRGWLAEPSPRVRAEQAGSVPRLVAVPSLPRQGRQVESPDGLGVS